MQGAAPKLDMTRGSVYSVSAYNRAVLIKQHNPPGQSITLSSKLIN